MLRIEIGTDSVRSLTSKAGRPFFLQTGWVHVLTPDGKPQPHPVKAEWFVDSPDKASSPGAYLLAPASIYVDRSGRLAVAPKLVPAPK